MVKLSFEAVQAFYYRNLLKFVGWVSPIVGKTHSPWSIKKIHAIDYRNFTMMFPHPGTVLVSTIEGEFGNIFIPDFWSHAAIYTGAGTVIEAVGQGVIETDLIDFMMRKDYIVAVEPTFATPEQMVRAVGFARAQIGKPYDFEFQTSDIKSFYCSELVVWAYSQVVKNTPFTTRKILGVETVAPSDFVLATKLWKEVWASKSVVTKKD